LVAVGTYEESLNVPNGVQLVGGYDPSTWQQSLPLGTVLDAPSLNFSLGADAGSAPSVLRGFEVHASVVVQDGAKVVIAYNRLVPKLEEVTWETYGDTHLATALSAKNASLRVQNNEIALSADDPTHVIGRGIIAESICARIVDNELSDFRIPISIHDSDEVTISFNRVTRGKNGFWLDSSDAALVGNVAQLTAPNSGCVYGLYLQGDAKPIVRGNDFSLETSNNRWVSEASVEADPIELQDNTLYLGSSGTVLYIDEATAAEARSDGWLSNIDDVNALSDVPRLAGNVVVNGVAQ
jgi:hypothetical protein